MKMFCYFIYLSILSVSYFNTNKIWQDNNGRSIVGTWDKLTIMNNKDTVLYSNRDALNAQIKIDSNIVQLYINYGQEDATYVIDEIKLVDNEFFISIYDINDTSKQKSTLKCKILDNEKSYWDYYGNGSYKINGVFNLFTNKPEKYKAFYEDMDK